MTIAFPVDVIRRLKYHFDETLETTEDWDFLMKVASVTGVQDVDQCTAIYRRWINTENSTTLYTQEEWRKTEQKIKNQFRPLLRISKARDSMIESENPEQTKNKEEGKHLEPEIRYGDQIEYATTFVSQGSNVEIRFSGPFKFKEEQEVRIDPFHFGGFVIQAPTIFLHYQGGKVLEFSGKKIKSNGYRRGNRIYFYFADPQLIIDVPEGNPISIELVCTRSNELLTREGIKLFPAVYFHLIGYYISYFYRRLVKKSNY